MRSLRRVGPLALALSLILLSTNRHASAADDKPEPKNDQVDLKALDSWIRKSLFYVIDHGAALHNSGDVKGGYQTFDDALKSIVPLLNHHPELQKYIKDGLATTERMSSLEDRSFELRKVLDKVRESLKTGGGVPVDKSLWDRLGGEKGVSALLDNFIIRASKDPRVNFGRGGKYKMDKETLAKVKKELMKQASYLSGGPDKPEKDATPPWKDLGITEAEFRVGREHLVAAMVDARVLQTDGKELITALDNLQKDIVAPKVALPKTVWEALGGEAGVAKLVDDFIQTAKEDKAVNFTRGGKYTLDADTLTKVKKELVNQISYLTNGPFKPMKDAVPPWKGLGITEAEFDAGAKHFTAALKKNNAPEKSVTQLAVVDIPDLRNKVVETEKPIDLPKKTLWERLDGDKGIAKIVDDYYAAASKNAKTNLNQGGTLKLDDPAVAEKIKKSLVVQISVATGGSVKAPGDIEKGPKLTAEEFDARKEELKKALEKNGVKLDDSMAVLEVYEKTRKDAVEPKKPPEPTTGSEVTGKVTVDGKPVAAGKIIFAGADKKKIEGDIKDGDYKVSGLKPGSYRVAIIGSEEIGASYRLPLTTPLQIELTKEKEMQDFNLPAKK